MTVELVRPATELRGQLEKLELVVGHQGRVWQHRGIPGRHDRLHRHHEIELNLVLAGTARYVVDAGDVDLAAGDSLLIWPRHAHALLEQSPDLAMWIVVVGQDLLARVCTTARSALLADPVGPERPLHWRGSTTQADRVDLLLRQLTAPGDAALHAAGLAYVLLWAFSGVEHNDGTAVEHYVHEARRLLDSGTVDWTVPRLARAVGTSASTLTRSFRQAYGRSIVQYRQESQLARACALYRDNNGMTLQEAAALAGFGSYSQFHRVFSRKHGHSPRAHSLRLQGSSTSWPCQRELAPP